MNSNRREMVCMCVCVVIGNCSRRLGSARFLALARLVGGELRSRLHTHSQQNTNDTEKIERVF